MKNDVWLRPNRRPGAALMAIAGAAGGIALILAIMAPPWTTITGRSAVAVAIIMGAAIAFAIGWNSIRRPRISRHAEHVWFRIGRRGQIAVPLDVIEAFFLGQGPAHLPAGFGQRFESTNLVARLSQRRTEWQQRDVDPRLASWCDGYITIRGTCCEPLSVDVIHRLNRQLSDAKRSTYEK